MTHFTVAGVTVHVDLQGRACLEDLHRAAVAARYVSEAYRPENFLALASTKQL